jgi:pilus assembly protein Flp/PilA
VWSPRPERPAPRSREGGQGLVEYALILVLVAIVVVVVLATMGKQIDNAFNDVVKTLTGG